MYFVTKGNSIFTLTCGPVSRWRGMKRPTKMSILSLSEKIQKENIVGSNMRYPDKKIISYNSVVSLEMISAYSLRVNNVTFRIDC